MRSRSTGPLILKWYCDMSLDLNIKQRNLRLRLTRSKFFATLTMNPLIKKMSVHNSRTHSTRALWAERTVLQLGRRVCIVRWVKAWDGVIVVESRHYVNRRNNKLPNQADTITASAFRGFVNLTSNLIRDLKIPEHNGAALAVPCLSHTVWLYNWAGALPFTVSFANNGAPQAICLPIYHYWAACLFMILHDCNRGFPRSHIRCSLGKK